MGEHTALPWTFDEVKTQCGRCFRIGSAAQLAEQRSLSRPKLPSYVCLYDDYGAGDNEAKARARLIVAAVNTQPAVADLVKALEEISELHNGDEAIGFARDTARSALSRFRELEKAALRARANRSAG